MKGALQLASTPDTKWTIKSGPMAGTVRLMNSSNFTIGRSADSDFVIINDPKCSRKHANVRWTATGFEIVALSDANKIMVNGREVSQSFLNDNDVIQLGETEMQFNLMVGPALVPDVSYRPQSPARGRPAAMPSRRPKARPAQPVNSANNNRRFIIVGVMGLILWIALSPDAKKKEADRIRTEKQMQADVEAANKLREIQEKRSDQVIGSVSHRQAQEHYVKGFRDYRKHQFERALESFQACLALQPDHPLCTRYYRLSQRKFDELIQYQMVLGRKYREQNQFKACRAAFRNVMVMVKDPQNTAYKEAKANYSACNAALEGRF